MAVKIVLEPGKPPAMIGAWTNGQVRAVLVAALNWLDSLPLTMPQEQPEDEVTK